MDNGGPDQTAHAQSDPGLRCPLKFYGYCIHDKSAKGKMSRRDCMDRCNFHLAQILIQ